MAIRERKGIEQATADARDPANGFARRRVLLAASLVVLSLLCAHHVTLWLNGRSVFLSVPRATEVCERALSELRAWHVSGYRDQSWCRLLTIDETTYMESSNPSTCCWAPAGCQEYDAAAKMTHARIRALLTVTGLHIVSFSVQESPEHELETAEFGLPSPTFFEYRAPGQAEPEGFKHEVEYRRIRPGWYLRLQDWN